MKPKKTLNAAKAGKSVRKSPSSKKALPKKIIKKIKKSPIANS